MRKSMLAACSAALFVASTVIAGAQTAPRPATTTAPPAATAPAKPAPAAPAAATGKKKPSEKQLAQQNKMKGCAKEWGEYKTKTGKSGKAEHQKFMSECLKR